MSNLEHSKTNKDLKELFPSEGCVNYVKEIRMLGCRLKDFGFVEMETDGDVSKSIIKAVLTTGSFWLMKSTLK